MPELKNIEMALLKARKEKENIERGLFEGLVNEENKVEFNQKLSKVRKEIAILEARNAELAEMVKLYDGEAKFEEVFKSLKTFSDLIKKTDRPEVLQRFVKSRVARIEMSSDKKQFNLKLRAFDSLYPDRVWWALRDSNPRPSFKCLQMPYFRSIIIHKRVLATSLIFCIKY